MEALLALTLTLTISSLAQAALHGTNLVIASSWRNASATLLCFSHTCDGEGNSVDWYAVPAGGVESVLVEDYEPLRGRYHINSRNRSLRLERLTVDDVKSAVFMCSCFAADKFDYKKFVVHLPPPEPPSSLCASVWPNLGKVIVRFKYAGTGTNIMNTLLFTVQVNFFLSNSSSIVDEKLKVRNIRASKCKASGCRMRQRIPTSPGGEKLRVDRMVIRVMVTDEHNATSAWTESSWPFCQDTAVLKKMSTDSWWISPQQTSLSSIVILLSMNLGQLAQRIQGWERTLQSAVLELTINLRSSNKDEHHCNRYNATTLIPALVAKSARDSILAVDADGLTRGCTYTTRLRVLYGLKPHQHINEISTGDLLLTHIEMRTQIHLSAMPRRGFYKHPAVLALAIKVSCNIRGAANCTRSHLQRRVAMAVRHSETLCGVRLSNGADRPEKVGIVPRGNAKYDVSYPLIVPHSAQLYHQCFRQRVAAMDIFNGARGVEVISSSVYDGELKMFI